MREAEVVTYKGVVWLIDGVGAGYLCEGEDCQEAADWYLQAGDGCLFLCEGCVYPCKDAASSTDDA